jgi:hypothetical protein
MILHVILCPLSAMILLMSEIPGVGPQLNTFHIALLILQKYT